MASIQYVPVCQWCGKMGARITRADGKMPTNNPVVPGNCPTHPSGKTNLPHGARWEKC